jgi:intradiol ring-cleaving dioxygenase-like protein
MLRIFSSLIVFMLFTSCIKSQNKPEARQLVGGPCEGCEAIFEYGDKILKPVDTLPLFMELENPIKISGKVLNNDGKTPASSVILYVYHTNDKGIYPSSSKSKGWERRHGYLRGWIKTDAYGNYMFYASRPASYPNSAEPQHIHITVKEPDKNEYYIENFYFNDDPNLTKVIKNRKSPRGGSGIVSLKLKGDIKEAKRTIILGLNIPNY